MWKGAGGQVVEVHGKGRLGGRWWKHMWKGGWGQVVEGEAWGQVVKVHMEGEVGGQVVGKCEGEAEGRWWKEAEGWQKERLRAQWKEAGGQVVGGEIILRKKRVERISYGWE